MKTYFSLVVQKDEEKGLIVIHIECDKEKFKPIMDLIMLSGAQNLRQTVVSQSAETTTQSPTPETKS